MRNIPTLPWVATDNGHYVDIGPSEYKSFCTVHANYYLQMKHADAKDAGDFIVRACNAYDETQQLLLDLAEYFDGKQDADDGQPNEEMRFAMRIKELQDA